MGEILEIIKIHHFLNYQCQILNPHPVDYCMRQDSDFPKALFYHPLFVDWAVKKVLRIESLHSLSKSLQTFKGWGFVGLHIIGLCKVNYFEQ